MTSPPSSPAPTPPPASPRRRWANLTLALGILTFLLFPVGLLLAVPAVIIGHAARRWAHRQPDRFGGPKRALAGLILGYTYLVGLLALLILLSPPNQNADPSRCISNLKQIWLAAQNYAAAHDDLLPPTLLALTNDLACPAILQCPASRLTPPRTWNRLTLQSITYQFLRPDLCVTNPKDPIIRCPVHQHVCLADGSVKSELPPKPAKKHRPTTKFRPQ